MTYISAPNKILIAEKKNMTDKEKINTLIHYYIRELDLDQLERDLNIEGCVLRYAIGKIIKGFTYPILESGDLKIK